MPTAADYQSQMESIQDQLGTYTPVDIGDVTSDFMNRVDFFRPQYEEQRGTQAQAYEAFPSMMKQYAEQYGEGGGAGPSAFQMLQSGLGNVGRLMGRSDVMGDVISRAGGRIEDLARSALGQYSSAQQALNQRYQNLMPLYQQQTALEEAERQRAWEAQQAELNRQNAMRAAAASVPNFNLGGDDVPAQSQNPTIGYLRAMKMLRDYSGAKVSGDVRKKYVDSILQQLQPGLYITPELAYRAGGFSDKWNPGLQGVPQWWQR